jgi:hypothetical protein
VSWNGFKNKVGVILFAVVSIGALHSDRHLPSIKRQLLCSDRLVNSAGYVSSN